MLLARKWEVASIVFCTTYLVVIKFSTSQVVKLLFDRGNDFEVKARYAVRMACQEVVNVQK